MIAHEELQTLRAEKATKGIDDKVFNARVASVIRTASQAYREGEMSETDYDAVRKEMGEVITVMNSSGRVAVFAALQGSEWFDQESYSKGVKLAIEYTFALNDAHKPSSPVHTDIARKNFAAGVREISKMLDELPVEVRVRALRLMQADTQKRVIASLPPAQQLRFRKELTDAATA